MGSSLGHHDPPEARHLGSPAHQVLFSQTKPLTPLVVTFHWCVLALVNRNRMPKSALYLPLFLYGYRYFSSTYEDFKSPMYSKRTLVYGLNDRLTAFLWCRFYAQVHWHSKYLQSGWRQLRRQQKTRAQQWLGLICVTASEYSMIYRGPGFLAVVWFDLAPCPYPSPSLN